MGLGFRFCSKSKKSDKATMASDTKPKPSTELPPSKINVQRLAESRADELTSLQSVITARLGGDFRSERGKRRRTTAFDSKAAGRRRKVRRKNSLSNATNGPEKKKLSGDVEAKVCRRARRREMLKMNPATGFSASGDGTKRLRTHVWHTKRFTMTKLWGFHLPLGLHGRGRGSRSLLKRFRDGVLIHDSSYYVAVQLEGPEDALLRILNMVLVPNGSIDTDAVLSGVAYGNSMLHGIGGPYSRAVAPVTYMWQHCCQGETDVNDQQESKESHSSTRRLWVWIHASASDEAYDALKSACQKEKDTSGIMIDCFSLEGQLAKLEVLGSNSFELLQRTLTVAGVSEGSLETEKRSVGEVDDESHLKKTSILDNGGQISPKAILSLHVVDPRTVKKKNEIDDSPELTSCDMLIDTPPDEDTEHKEVMEISERNKEPFSFHSEISGNSTIACESLWALKSGVIPPLEESVLCKEKQEQRKKFFCLDDQILSQAQGSRCCPVMLLKNEAKNGLSIGWSVILPLSWVKAFWVPFVSNGARAIGLREKHWVSCEVGLPYFPSDFPDCNAYSRLKGAEDEASSLKLELRPSAVRPTKVPIPPPWDSVRFTLNKTLKCADSPKIYWDYKQDTDLELIDRENLIDGFIARTSHSLAGFLNKIEGKHLLLFPRTAGKKLCFEETAKDESEVQSAQNRVVNINNDRRLCFLRVLLHAFKEGSFEEGAVVCAPHLTDIKLWTSSVESGEESLQLSQTGVKNYFKEKSHCRWELQIPEECNSSEALRFPIGFVTTGFVRGSKKVAAEAYCMAVLLAQLRKEQWSDIPAKRRRKETFVLVRNLRSTAYRLALATIVVESQEEDLDFL